jgi:hypothetical protein
MIINITPPINGNIFINTLNNKEGTVLNVNKEQQKEYKLKEDEIIKLKEEINMIRSNVISHISPPSKIKSPVNYDSWQVPVYNIRPLQDYESNTEDIKLKEEVVIELKEEVVIELKEDEVIKLKEDEVIKLKEEVVIKLKEDEVVKLKEDEDEVIKLKEEVNMIRSNVISHISPPSKVKSPVNYDSCQVPVYNIRPLQDYESNTEDITFTTIQRW